MLMPGGDKAVVDDAKLTGYILNPEHPLGRHHARLFRALLAIDRENAGQLKQDLLVAAKERDAQVGRASEFGQKYEIRFQARGPRGFYTVVSVWIVPIKSDTPYLVTAYIE